MVSTSPGSSAQAQSSDAKSQLDFMFARSLEFRQEIIYFIVVDRFCDGDTNNSAGPNPKLYDPNRQSWNKYWGGDLRGVISKLDYLQNMGVTALWLTPLFEQIEEELFDITAMAGYWTKDFKRINPRLVAPGEEISLVKSSNTVFDELIAELHKRGMKMILDIVCNHSSPDAGGKKGQLYDDGVLIADFHNDTKGWYHHYGEVQDWNSAWQVENEELAGLADFNENNTEYRAYIKSAIKLWLDRGVDALRVDTVKHMPLWFWQEFTSDMKTHKPSLFMFGEWIYSGPQDPLSITFANKSGMSILDYNLAVAIRRGMAQGDPGGFYVISEAFEQDHIYTSASELITFLDNHDIPRFQSLNGDGDILRLAVNLIMTSRGIPCVYYGTEQYLHNDTNGGHEPYNRPMMENWDTNTIIYREIKILSDLRRHNPAVALGAQIQKYLTNDVYCYLRRYRDHRCFVAMSKSYGPVTIHEVSTDFPDGNYTCLLTGRQFEVKNGCIYNLYLGPKEMIVISHVGTQITCTTVVMIRVNGISTKLGETVAVIGDCPELGNWDIEKAFRLDYINKNQWFGEIPFHESVGKPIAYKYVLLRENDSPERENCTARRWLVANEGIVKLEDTWAW
nr:alpha-amylase family glycosyl hydrolase [[Phormidium] sp. ETS-05]